MGERRSSEQVHLRGDQFDSNPTDWLTDERTSFLGHQFKTKLYMDQAEDKKKLKNNVDIYGEVFLTSNCV